MLYLKKACAKACQLYLLVFCNFILKTKIRNMINYPNYLYKLLKTFNHLKIKFVKKTFTRFLIGVFKKGTKTIMIKSNSSYKR